MISSGACHPPIPLWGAPRIVGEFAKIGIDLPMSTVAKYMVRRRTPPSATRRAFLKNHVKDIAARSSWQTPFAERLIGSIGRERLDHLIVVGRAAPEAHRHPLHGLLPSVALPSIALVSRPAMAGQWGQSERVGVMVMQWRWIRGLVLAPDGVGGTHRFHLVSPPPVGPQ